MTRRRIAVLSAVAIVVGLAAAVLLVPLSAFRGPLEAAASAALSRDVQVHGSLHLTVFPQLGISLKDVSIANTAGARDPQMITVGKVLVGARLMPLLSGRLVVTKVVLKQPVIHLEIGKDGVGNWQFGQHANGVAENPFADGRLGIHSARIDDGEIDFFDARTGRSKTLSAVSMSLSMTRTEAGRTLAADGTATYHSVPLKLASSLGDADGFFKGQPSSAHVQVSSALFDADFTGRLGDPSSITGELKLTAPSLRKLAAWAGNPLPPGNGLGAVAIESGISAKEEVYALSKATISLDGMKLTGDVSIDSRPSIPALKGTLAIDRIDIRPYLAPGTSEDIAKVPNAPGHDTPLALGGLKGADADLTITVGGLVLPDFALDRAVVAASLHGGVLKAQVKSLSAYGGTGMGNLTVDTTGALPGIHDVLEMSGVKVETFLGEVIGVRRISGSGSIRLDLTARGLSETELVKSLNGSGSITIAGGTIAGADLSAVARVVQSTLTGQFLTGAVGPNAGTEFSNLAGTFTIQNGVMRTSNLRMIAPAVEMTGSGVVDLSTHRIDFHFDPRSRQGLPVVGAIDIGIPFYVTGSWDNPSFGADPVSVAKGIVNSVGGAATRLPGEILEVPGDALRSLFGNQ